MAHHTRDASRRSASEGAAKYLIVHLVVCPGSSPAHSQHAATAVYLDVPRLFQGDSSASPLRGRSPGCQAQQQAKEDANISFIIYRSYSCIGYHSSLHAGWQGGSMGTTAPLTSLLPGAFMQACDAAPAVPYREHMEINSRHLSDAIEAIRASRSHPQPSLSGWDREQNMLAPYLHFYHIRQLLHSSRALLPEPQQQHLSLLLEYLDSHFGHEYDEADQLFAQACVTEGHFHKLFGPGEILVTVEGDYPVAMIVKYPPLPDSDPIRMDCETWSFDGRFSKHARSIAVAWPQTETGVDKIPVRSLTAFPLRFDRSGLEHELRKRGEVFWACRKRRFVSYFVPRESLQSRMRNGRYMIDNESYRHFHGGGNQRDSTMNRHGEQLAGEIFDSDSPPPGSFVLLLPPTIHGFAFHDKTWRTLAVQHIMPITWNKEAFSHLVLPAQSKEFLSALVVDGNASRREAASDGDGVVILLHGAPGTGKSFAAEAVAELAEKPLYRLDPSDIGTNLEKIGENLNDAFHLSSIWNAVVLLDECDVFLEQRKLTDLNRNSVVSVMLRALDQWKGILILTSTRVGTLDDALHSRVQLAVEFPSYKETREQLWQVLTETSHQGQGDGETEANFGDLPQAFSRLERHNLSGREMRNIIETARRLALYRGEPVSLKHVEEALGAAREFIEYIFTLNKGRASRDIAREQGLR